MATVACCIAGMTPNAFRIKPFLPIISSGKRLRMAQDTYEHLTQLGSAQGIPASPDEATLETVPNPHAGTHYLVRFTCPEFTSLCPVTGQPDFAHLVIDYAPGDWLVESKSLKLFLTSFRGLSVNQATDLRRIKPIDRSGA